MEAQNGSAGNGVAAPAGAKDEPGNCVLKINNPSGGSRQGNPLLAAALACVAKGWPVYPARPLDETVEAYVQRIKHLTPEEQKKKKRGRAKQPRIKGGVNAASTEPATLRSWWDKWPDASVGLATSERAGFWVLDSDKPYGEETIAALEAKHGPLPPTLTVKSGSGGLHRFYRWPTDGRVVRSKAGELGVNLDQRGNGGGVIFPPSSHPSGFAYAFLSNPDAPIAELPAAWLELVTEEPEVQQEKQAGTKAPVIELDQEVNIERAREFLSGVAPVAVKGEGGRDTTYKNICRLRDMGLSEEMATELMLEEYNPQKCSPTWEEDLLTGLVVDAYRYAKGTWGSDDAPENAFSDSYIDEDTLDTIEATKPKNPIDELNTDHAFTLVMGKPFVVRENNLTSPFSDPLTWMTERGFITKYGNRYVRVPDGDKKDSEGNPKTKLRGLGVHWLGHPKRRTIEKVDFYPPPQIAPADHINLYRGASIKPLEAPAPERCEKFIGFVKDIICNGDAGLFKYVLAWIADIAQNPGGRKPGVCLVLRGGQGTGKGTFADNLVGLFSPYAIKLDRPDQLVGRFNGHMANKLLVVADEAFWAGDRSKVGPLKSFVTENQLPYEWKGRDLVMMSSYHRVVMLSNNEWVVPADVDDRRFTVLDISNSKAQDTEYFGEIWREMDNGGREAFFRMMLDHDYSDVNVRSAPKTQGLLDQKLESMDDMGSFVLDLLTEGRIPLVGGVGSEEPWPKWIHKEELYNAFVRSLPKDRERYKPRPVAFGRKLKRYMPGVDTEAKGPPDDAGRRPRVFGLPALERARADFDKLLGQPMPWAT
jgi:hypothetical protein